MKITARRIRPNIDPRSIVGSERDVAVLASIAWARVLATAQLERLHFPSRRRAQRRLRALLDHGLIRAHLQGEALHRDNVWTLSARGADLLAEHEYAAAGQVSPTRAPRLQKLAHALAVRDVFISFVLAERAGDFALAEFHFEEDLATEPVFRSVGLIPDGLATLSDGASNALVGIEVDLGTETTTTLREKLSRWRVILSSRSGPFADCGRLLIAANSPRRVATLQRLVDEAQLSESAVVAELREIGCGLGRGWPHTLTARGVRTERPVSSAQVVNLDAVRAPDAGAFRALDPFAVGVGVR